MAARQQPRCPIWVAGRPGKIAGPRRALRHGLEGVALVGAEVWSPADVTDMLEIGGPGLRGLDLALVGGRHPDPEALAAAGATWALVEVLPGTSARAARDTARSAPPAAGT